MCNLCVCLVHCVDVHRQQKKYDEATKLYQQAARYYLEDGKPDRASEVLMKAAKVLENSLKENKSIFVDEPTIQLAIQVYKKVIDIFHNEQKYHMMADPLRSYNSFLLKQGFIKEAIENFKLSIEAFTALKQTHNMYVTCLLLAAFAKCVLFALIALLNRSHVNLLHCFCSDTRNLMDFF